MGEYLGRAVGINGVIGHTYIERSAVSVEGNTRWIAIKTRLDEPYPATEVMVTIEVHSDYVIAHLRWRC